MSEYDDIKRLLTDRKESLVGLLDRVEKSARRKLDKNYEDQAIQRENEEVLTSLDDSLNDELEQIENALLKIEKGDYGKCEDCGKEISVKRLKAVPHASFCIKCAV